MAAPPPLARRLAFALLAACVGLAVLELGFRVLTHLASPDLAGRIDRYRHEWAPDTRALTLDYRPHPYLVYVYDHRVNPDVNALGFYFDDLSIQKPPGTLRVATFGGSTTAGPQAWPRLLQDHLSAALGRRVEVLNFGVSGWTSAEGLIAYTHLAQSYDLDAIVLHHVNNDLRPLEMADFRPDYAHFRRPAALIEEGDQVNVRWTGADAVDDRLTRLSNLYIYARLWTVGPPRGRYSLQNLSHREGRPGSPDATDRNSGTWARNLYTMGRLAQADGAVVAVMTMPHIVQPGVGPPGWGDRLEALNRRLRALAADQGYALIDAAADPAFTAEVFEDPIHVTAAGEQRKAAMAAAALVEAGLGRE